MQPYLLPGLELAVLRGRDEVLGQICRDLTKPTPNNVSIVGPRYFGKTLLMRALTKNFEAKSSGWDVVCYWDLRHGTPTDDQSFVQSLARHLDKKLLDSGFDEFHEYLDPDAEDLRGLFEIVIGTLETRGVRVLVLLDDFDRLAEETQITKNLWDYLRSLAQRCNFRFVTSSRKGLRELIPSRESRTSDFFNLFQKIALAPFDGPALDQFLAPMVEAGFVFDEAAKTALGSKTGGVPVVCAAVCASLMTSQPCRITREHIGDVSEKLLDSQVDLLAQLWDDCNQETQRDLLELASGHSISLPLVDRRRLPLLQRGYAKTVGARLEPSCGILLAHASRQEGSTRDLKDLLGDVGSRKKTLQQMLELMVAEIDGPNTELLDFLEHAISGLKRGSRAALLSIRSFSEEALSIAWDSEFPGNVIPGDVQRQLTLSWKEGGCGIPPDDLGKIDRSNVRRRILRLASGDEGRMKVTQKITRPTMIFIEHLHDVGDFGQHMQDLPPEREAPVTFDFCVSACFSAVTLLARLTQDIRVQDSRIPLAPTTTATAKPAANEAEMT